MRTPLREKLGPLARERVYIPERPTVSEAKKLRIHTAHNGKCGICGAVLPVTGPTVAYDHQIPRFFTGRDDDEAFWPLCTVPCHARKTVKDMAEIAEARRRELKDAGQFPEAKGNNRLQGRKFQSRWTP